MKRKPYARSEDDFLRREYPMRPTRELSIELGRPLSGLYRHATKILGLRKSEEYLASPAACRLRGPDGVGAAHRFLKGHVPANKGLRRPGYSIGRGRMRQMQFRKGDRSRNYLPIGTVRVDSDGWLRRKIADGIGGFGNQNVWEFVHRRTWENAHGPIPADRIVAIKDGNRINCALDNLELITRAQNMRTNSIHAMRSPEVKSAIYALIALKRSITIREKKNGKKQAQRST